MQNKLILDTDWAQSAVEGMTSIIMPCYNVENFVGDAITSVLDQDVAGSLELLVADDGSTDRTRDILAACADRDQRVVLLEHSERTGPFAVRNRALKRSRGEWIAFLDSDDVWYPQKLTKQLQALAETPEAGLCHSNFSRIDANGNPVEEIHRHRLPEGYAGHTLKKMIVENGVGTSTVVIKRQVFADVGGFDEAFHYRGDWEMWTRISSRYPFVFVDEPLCQYRMHDTNVSLDPKKLYPYAFAVLKRFEEDYGSDDPKMKALLTDTRLKLHRGFGRMFLVDRVYPLARKELYSTLRMSHFEPQVLMDLAKSYLYPILRR